MHTNYDYNTYYGTSRDSYSYGAYGALVLRKAVCEGYSEAYEYLMNEVGIPTDSIISQTMNHERNAVLIDGKFYYVTV